MSRIGKQPVTLPTGVKATVDGTTVKVEGPKGKLEQTFHHEMAIALDGGAVVVTRPSDQKRHKALHGLTRALIQNMVTGVEKGYEKVLEIHGNGYNASAKGSTITLQIGFCHPVDMHAPEGVAVEVVRGRPIKIKLSGIDKNQLTQFAANVRRVRPPEPYKEKGIRYEGEVIRKKAGKAFGSGK